MMVRRTPSRLENFLNVALIYLGVKRDPRRDGATLSTHNRAYQFVAVIVISCATFYVLDRLL